MGHQLGGTERVAQSMGYKRLNDLGQGMSLGTLLTTPHLLLWT